MVIRSATTGQIAIEKLAAQRNTQPDPEVNQSDSQGVLKVVSDCGVFRVNHACGDSDEVSQNRVW